MKVLTYLFAMTLTLGGCGGSNGVTECGSGKCSAGTYCAETSTGTCQPGCTSDDNCSDNKTCLTGSGSAVGLCRDSAECTSDGDCTDGYFCDGGACEPT